MSIDRKIEYIGDDRSGAGPITSNDDIQILHRVYQDARPEEYYCIQLHTTCCHMLTPERAIDLYNKLHAALMDHKDLIENWRGVTIKNPERYS